MTSSELTIADFNAEAPAYAGNPNEYRIQLVRAIVQSLSTQRFRILDVGCADGLILRPFTDRHEIHGVDVCGPLLGKVRGFASTRLCDLDSGEALPFEGGWFDLVFSGETIEHIVDTDHYLSQVY